PARPPRAAQPPRPGMRSAAWRPAVRARRVAKSRCSLLSYGPHGHLVALLLHGLNPHQPQHHPTDVFRTVVRDEAASHQPTVDDGLDDFATDVAGVRGPVAEARPVELGRLSDG